MAILKVNQLVKRFGGLTAVDHLDLEINKGEVVGLIGPNGSGKTTVLNLITGIYQPDDDSSIMFKDEEMRGLEPHSVCKKGIARTFQNIRILESQTVYDNVRLGMHIQTKADLLNIIFNTRKIKNENNAIRKEIEEILDFMGMLDLKDEKAKNLPYGKQKLLEIARAVVAKPELLLLDEPAAGLNNQETDNLAEIVKRISKRDITVLLIEHTMSFVEALTNKVVVINYGKKISEGTFAHVKQDPTVIEAYLGTRGDE